MKFARGTVFAILSAAVGCYYLWAVRAAGEGFLWGYDLGGYYNYLGRGFAGGHLYVPIQPAPELLALSNPWDPAVNDSYKMQDMAFYHGHYYLYHGAAPAVLLFTPWRLATGHDLPENFALFLLCFGGFLFSCGALLRILTLARATPTPFLLAVMMLGLGICQSIPYLLSRVWVYEIAIGGGYLCVSGAVYFLAMGVRSPRSRYWLAASGLMFGLAVACRPPTVLAAAVALAGVAYVLIRSRRFASLIAFLAPMALAGAALAGYNYLRFGDPFEFGIRYLLTGANQNRIHLNVRNIPPGLYFLLFCPPDFSLVFPWVRQVFRFPFNSLFPPEYFIEPTVGALCVAPFLAGAPLAVFANLPGRDRERAVPEVRILLSILLAASASILLFLTATGFTTHRYEADFLPLAALVALSVFGIYLAQSAGWRRAILQAALVISIAYSAIANLALGVSGPYDEMLKKRPASYVRIARWLSPIEQYRPVLNPELEVDFIAEFTPQADGFREPLVTIGREHFIYAEHVPGGLRIVSRSDGSTVAREFEAPDPRPVAIRVTYESGKLTTQINGEPILSQNVTALVAAPAQVTVGENRIDPGVTVPRFTGRIQGFKRTRFLPSKLSTKS